MIRQLDFSTPIADRCRLLVELGCDLPEGFYSFYEHCDGGHFYKDFLSFDGSGHNIHRIFSVTEIIKFRRTTHVWQIEDEPVYPDDVLAFANDAGGNFTP